MNGEDDGTGVGTVVGRLEGFDEGTVVRTDVGAVVGRLGCSDGDVEGTGVGQLGM